MSIGNGLLLGLLIGCGAAEQPTHAALTRQEAEVLRQATRDVIRNTIPHLPRSHAREELAETLEELAGLLAAAPADSLNRRITYATSLLPIAAPRPADTVHAQTIELLLLRTLSLSQSDTINPRSHL